MNPTFPLFGLSRLRMGSDGKGVTTLVAARGCPLMCRLCLNPQSLSQDTPVKHVTPKELYDLVRKDDLYFQATGGGITFGGGEPLLHAPFIRAFREICGDKWQLNAETCLNIPEKNLRTAMECLDNFIVDIKDMNPDIYRDYTGQDNNRVMQNLKTLLSGFDPDRIIVRVPRIPGYNTDADVEKSLAVLHDMGVIRFDRFTYIIPDRAQ